ncbi:MAG: hypothetical protein HY902_00210 [Deltaproteobacteria bacterium]|nr:hypothetical protein [Deltaproteobacteria bacterium]
MPRRLSVFWAGLILVFLSCTPKAEPDPPANKATLVSPKAHVVDLAVATTVQVGPDTLRFPKLGNEGLLKLPVGDFLVAGAGKGFLRKIVATAVQGDTIVVQTTQALLTDAIVNGSLSTKLMCTDVNPLASPVSIAFSGEPNVELDEVRIFQTALALAVIQNSYAHPCELP